MKQLIIILFILLSCLSVDAKDLFVATDGSDAVTYANNDIDNPWLTVAHAWANALDNDTVYYRQGSYPVNTEIDVASGGHNVTHTSYTGEQATWTSTLDDHVINIGEPDTTIDNIDVEWTPSADPGDSGFFILGWASNISSPPRFTVQYCNFTIGGSSPSGNFAAIHARLNGGERADDAIIQFNTFDGPGTEVGSANTTAIITFQARNWTIKNNEIHDYYNGLYYNKHPDTVAGSDGLVENNYIYDCHAAMYTQANSTTYRNNIIDGTVRMGFNGGDATDGNVGSDYNVFDHNTITGGIIIADQTDGGDNEYPGAQFNTWEDNILASQLNFYASNHNTSMNYNLYKTGDIVQQVSSYYNLSEWQTENSSDANSLSNTPDYVGGVNPTTIAGFALDTGSPGINAASDGTDMGADVTLVGVDAAGDASTGNTQLGSGTPVDISDPTAPTVVIF